jgi:hypothetical protein
MWQGEGMDSQSGGSVDFSLKTLREETVGGRISLAIEPDLEGAVAAALAQNNSELGRFEFWRAASPSNYRPALGLWLPQRRAVQFALAYVAARIAGDRNASHEAALVKMPTGTGKTAAIATLACACPGIKKVLIITPRKGLVEQMRRDLSYRFWSRLEAIFENHAVCEGASAEDRARVEAAVGNGSANPVRVLEADQYRQIWDDRTQERQILVSTFNALHLALGIEPPAHRSYYGRSPRPPAGSLATLDPTLDSRGNQEAFAKFLRSFDLVIVDEGHYEPAVSWAQAVRALNRPTLIFSATPYRNDYKYFDVQGSFTFNLPWDEAVAQKLVREVAVGEPLTEPVPGDRVSPPSEAQAFIAACRPALAGLPTGKRVIIHAGSFERLKDLQEALVATGEKPVLIHDGYRKPPKTEFDALSPDARDLLSHRFRQVAEAEKSAEGKAARVWLHQFKLLEGIDDSRFIEAWLYDPFQSARQQIQQVGRIIRRPDLGDADGQTAVIRASDRAIASSQPGLSIAAQAAERWDSYLEYERYIATAGTQAFIAETQLLATVKRTAPTIQYVGREFRRGHLLDETPDMGSFLLPRRATVCRVRGVIDHNPGAIDSGTLDRLAAAAVEAMQVEERFDIKLIEAPLAAGYDDVRLIRYLSWRSSPYLAEHHLPEWRLGLMAIARAGRYVFLLDTESMCLDTSRLGLLEPDPDELKRLFPKDQTRIVETSASGLDLGELALRSLTVRRHALDEGYFDLAEASQVPTVVQGYGPLGASRARRRLSLGRARVADASFANLPVKEWAAWTGVIADALANEHAHQHRYFSRFAEQRKPLAPADAEPKSILLDLWDILEADDDALAVREWDSEAAGKLLDADSYCEVRQVGTDSKPKYEFTFAGHTVGLKYLYRGSVPAAGRYKLSSKELNDAVRVKGAAAQTSEEAADLAGGPFGSRRPPTLLGLLNQEQSFRIIPAAASTVYAHGSFFKPRVDAELMSILEESKLVTSVVSEKGDTRVATVTAWETATLFGLVWGWMDLGPPGGDQFAADMSACNIMICDDSTNETADFYGIDDANDRVLIVHSKAGDGPPSATARKLQEVGRQAQTSLAFAIPSGRPFDLPTSWSTDWNVVMSAAGGAVVTKKRLIKSPPGMTIEEAHARLAAALASPRYRKQIVVQTAGLLSKAKAEKTLSSSAQRSRQFVYYLASLRTSFDRAGVELRIICNP